MPVRRLLAPLVVAALTLIGSPVWAGNTVGGIVQNAVVANGNGSAVTVYGTFLVATYVVSGTFVATVNFEASGADGSFQSLGCTPATGGTSVSSATATGAWRCNIVGMIQIRARVSSYVSGSVTVSLQASDTGTVLIGPPVDSGGTLLNPTLSGTVAGQPTWASSQTFPGLQVSGGLGVNRAPPATSGQYAATNAANSGTMVTLTRSTDTSPAGNFLNFQTSALASLFTLDITGKVTAYGGASPTDGQLLIGGTTAGNWSAATLTGTANQLSVTNGAAAITLSLVGPYTPSTYTTNGVLYGATTSSILATAQGPANSVLTANAGAPSFSATPTLTSLTLGSGTAITQIKVYAPSLTPAQLAAAIGVSEQTFTVTGLTTADNVSVNGPAPQALCPPITYRVSATDTLAIGFVDLTVALCTPSAGTYLVVAVRS